MTDPEEIADDTIFTARDAAQDEAACWRVLDLNGRGAIAVRDREPLRPPDMSQPETAMYERYDFSDRGMAESYVQWRAIKAALLSVRAVLQEKG